MIDAYNRRAAVLRDGINNAGLRKSQPCKKERTRQGGQIHGSSRDLNNDHRERRAACSWAFPATPRVVIIYKIVEGYGPRPHAEGEEYRRILRASMTGYPGNRGNTAAQL